MRLVHRRRVIAVLCTLATVITLLAVPAGPAGAQPNPPAPCPTLPPGTTTPSPSTTSPESSEPTETTEPTTVPTETSDEPPAPTDASDEPPAPTETPAPPTASTTPPTETSAPPTASTTAPGGSAGRCDTLEALQQAMPSVIAGSLNPPTIPPDPGAALTTEGDDTKVDVPKDPAGEVTLNGSSAPPIAVGLPAESAQPAVAANQGVAVYQQAAPQTSVAVQPVGQGAARVMQVITGPKAPTTYRFPLQIPPGGSIQRVRGSQQGYVILDANGDGVGSISAPWSHDARQDWVDTHYRLEGHTLVQQVNHRGHPYPVVADPLLSLGCGWLHCSVYLTRSATRTLGRILKATSPLTGLAIARAAAGACSGLSGGTAVMVCIAAGEILGQALVNALVNATAQGGCLRIRFGPPLLVTAASVSHGSYCSDGARHGERRKLPPGERLVIANHASYLLVGGAKLWIPNREEFEAQAYDWSKVKKVSRQALRRFGDVPIDGTLIKERSDPHTFVISGRHRWWVKNRGQFTKHHFNWKKVHIVANGSLVSVPYAGPLP
jgi:hypothetical protein